MVFEAVVLPFPISMACKDTALCFSQQKFQKAATEAPRTMWAQIKQGILVLQDLKKYQKLVRYWVKPLER